MSVLIRVEAPHFVAGLVVVDNRVTEAAPILKYAIGWDRAKASAYFRTKNWKATIVTEIDLTLPSFLDRRNEPKALVYSFTLLNTYRNICGHQAKRRYIDKAYPFVPTPQSEWGNQVHRAMELRVNGGKPLPQNMHQWEKFAAPFYASKAKGELKLGMTAAGQSCDFFAKDVWLRGALDVNLVSNNTAMIFDYKTTSKPREDPFEMEIHALLLNAKYPNLTSITGCFIWLAENRIGQKHDVSHTKDTFTYIQRIAADLEEDMRNGEFEKRRGGLCPYCPCSDCEHFTGGNGR